MDADKSPGGGDVHVASSGYALSGKIMLTAIVVLFAAVLLVLFLHLYLRWRTLHRSSALSSPRRRRRRRHLSFAAADAAAPSSSAADSRGLDPAVLKCIPEVVFLPADGAEEGGGAAAEECAVCISEFERGEEVRRLPRRGHQFHVECIDMWFRSHATCPLCRSAVVAPAPAVQTVFPKDPPSSSRTLATDLRCPVPARGEGAGTSSSDIVRRELRIDVAARELAAEEAGLGSKSPGAGRLLLRRILSGDLMLCRGGDSGGSPGEQDLERGDELSLPSPPPPSGSPVLSPVMGVVADV